MPAAETSFTALRVEGGLFPAEFLARVAGLEAPAQRPDDYDVPPGRTVRDEIGRYWTIAEALWKEYRSQSQREGHDRSRVGVERWMMRLLRDVFGYGDLTASPSRSVIGERSFPITHWAQGGKLPLLITTANHALDKSDRLFGEDGRKRAPHATMQEFLNADAAVLWGVVTNGVRLRILRDNPSLTRPAFVEADFERIFDEGLYADFTALWLLLHASRFAPDSKGIAGARLEAWRAEGAKTGQRALEKLRAGVTTALRELGTGFVENPANDALRIALRDGTLTADGLHQQLLRLVYRMLLLFTAEERDLLHPAEADADARDVYRNGYSLGRVRDRARFRRHYDRYGDLWAGLTTTFRALSRGSKPLGLPAMGGLFDPLLCPDLDKAELANARLLAAVHALAYFTSDGALNRVNYRDMGTEELGSVYESLLELHPVVQVAERPWTFAFVGDDLGGSAKGNERKLSGSYYTPDSLVQELLRSALDPVIERTITENPGDPRAALLKLRVIDPACGSGHFLLGAARRLADAVARLESETDLPDEAIRRHALREVVRRCIYGVDRNPLSVELCKTALWIEAIEPGKPLSFLDAHIKCGDSLVGVFDLKVLKDGIPDEAFKELTGDDKAYCRDLKKRNAAERKTPHLGFLSDASVPPALASAFNALADLPEDTVEQVEEKAHALKRLQSGKATYDLKIACDLWCAAFFLPKVEKPEFVGRDLVPTTDTVWRYVRSPSTVYGPLIGAASEVADRARFFHWPLEFPEAFAVGGFDCVLGNPPWERIKLSEQEFFGSRHLEIADAPNASARRKMIAALESGSTAERLLHREFAAAKRDSEASSQFVRSSDRYPLTAVGDVNVYALFAEHFLGLIRLYGRAGLIVPTGIATDDSTKAYFDHVSSNQRLVSLFDFENRDGLFPSVHRSYKFSLLTLGSGVKQTHFTFFVSDVVQLADGNRSFALTPEEVWLINPNTRTCPTFRSSADAEIGKAIYRRTPVLTNDNGPNSWRVQISRAFDMNKPETLALCSSESSSKRVPMWEAKMIHQFDHRWASYGDTVEAERRSPSYEITPRYWVEEDAVRGFLTSRNWKRDWLFGWRDICRATDERSAIAAFTPLGGTDFTIRLATMEEPVNAIFVVCAMNSLIFDYCARCKLAGTHLSDYITKQLPIPPRELLGRKAASMIKSRGIELSYTSFALRSFAEDMGYAGSPFEWDHSRRAHLRAELDAIYANLYGLTRDELRYILDPSDVFGPDFPSETFRVLKEKEIRQFGEYRTAKLVLQAWDRFSSDGTFASFDSERNAA